MSTPSLTEQENAWLEEVTQAHKTAEDYSKGWRDRCDELYAHYRGYKGVQGAVQQASPRDRDVVLRDAASDWGADLVIPMAFSTVETLVSRMISNRPKMLILPREEDREQQARNMKALIDQQQQRIFYETKLEDVAKNGLIYGIGIQKLCWETRWGTRPALEKRLVLDPQTQQMKPQWVRGRPTREKVFDDWNVETIDAANFFWDPFGYDMDSVRWVIHRTWRSTGYVVDRLKEGTWNTLAAQQLVPEDVDGLGGEQRHDEAFQTQWKIAGFEAARNQRDKQLHEIWEYHTQDGRVIMILDRQVPVQMGENPYDHGQLPFSVFRPTTAGIGQLVGIGAVEPIEPLLTELSTLRSQRRDNASLKLAQVFAANEGAMEASDMQFFPGAVWPTHGDPKEALYPINVGDIPNSSYNEEDRIVGDIERTTGISDSVTGAEASGGAQTATGVQLVQAAANVRIQKQTRRLEVELIMRETGQAVALNQQMITDSKNVQLGPEAHKPGQIPAASETVILTPEELQGRMAVEIEGGSTAPKNIPQMRQDAQALDSLKGDPMFDQRAVGRRKAELLGFVQPEAIMAPEEPPIPADVLKRLEQAGVDPDLIQAAVAQGQREDPTSGQASGQGQQQPAPDAPAPAEEAAA